MSDRVRRVGPGAARGSHAAIAALAICLAWPGALAAQSPDFRPRARPVTLSVATIEAANAAAPADLPAGADDAPQVQPAGLAAPGGPSAPPDVGPETNLPLPRYVSLKVSEGNVRRGPSLSHRIDWVFLRRDMPLQVVAEYGHWRRVIDREGLGGWVHYSLLSGVRTVIVDQDMLDLHARADDTSPVSARLEAGVIARLGDCDGPWCRISAGGYRGWVPRTALWGVTEDESRG